MMTQTRRKENHDRLQNYLTPRQLGEGRERDREGGRRGIEGKGEGERDGSFTVFTSVVFCLGII